MMMLDLVGQVGCVLTLTWLLQGSLLYVTYYNCTDPFRTTYLV